MRRLLGAFLLLSCTGGAPLRPEPGFVSLTDVDPSIELDIRYAGTENFVGAVVDGYEAARCLLTPEAAHALASVQSGLRARGLGLRVFDCYRPRRAVAHFVRWAQDPEDTATRARHYPFVPKGELIDRGYIAEGSSHSRGSAVDLTLVGPEGDALDMGTPFDFFDPRSHTESGEVPAAARENRLLLRDAMVAGGFRNLPEEWWHYALVDEPWPDRSFDEPVR